MKKLFIFTPLIILLISFSLKGQNLIKNSNFEELKDINCPYTCYFIFTCDDYSKNFCSGNGCANRELKPFFLNGISDWKNASGTPQLYSFSCPSPNNIVLGSNSAFLTSNTINALNIEGIYQNNVNFYANDIYNLSIKYMTIGTPKLVIKAANGVTESTQNSLIPSTSSSEIITEYTTPSVSNWGTILVQNYNPSANYNQLLIYAVPITSNYSVTSGFIIDEVSITKSCCKNYQVYTNQVNPPSIKVQDYIDCNSNVVFNNNSNTYFSAKNSITLENNITVDGVESFVLQAEDCLAKQVEFYTQLDRVECDYIITLSACFGSGQYKFYIDEEEKETQTYPLSSESRVVTVKIEDLVNGTIITKTITIPASPPFFGNPTFNFGNVFTPNGDGINDTWAIVDGGKNKLAYNAYKYKLQIFDRWGNNIKTIEKEIDHNNLDGFNDHEFYWDGKDENGNCNDDTYYYILEFWNCSGHFSYNGSVTEIGCPSNLIASTKVVEELNNNIYFKTELNPNPTNDFITLKVFTNDIKTLKINVLDILGKTQSININIGENKYGFINTNIDCTNLVTGIYFCQISNNNKIENIKFSVIK